MAKRIQIVSKINGVGLDQDVRLLKNALELAGFQVSFSQHHGVASFWKVFDRSKRFDANIFVERAFSFWFGSAKKNFLIPNQERFPERLLPVLKSINAILCKTQHAMEIFRNHHNFCFYIGFTSLDKFDVQPQKDFSRFFHLAGKSEVKGTEDILRLWSKHPEWPELVLVQNPSKAPKSVPGNVRLYAQRLDEMELRELQNTIGVHLCLSRCEGWGHYIVEAMSTGALVITTNGEPMNELVDSSRGCLIDVARTESRHLGRNHYFEISHLESEVERIINLSIDEKEALGMQARNWFMDNEARFSKTLSAVLMDLI